MLLMLREGTHADFPRTKHTHARTHSQDIHPIPTHSHLPTHTGLIMLQKGTQADLTRAKYQFQNVLETPGPLSFTLSRSHTRSHPTLHARIFAPTPILTRTPAHTLMRMRTHLFGLLTLYPQV